MQETIGNVILDLKHYPGEDKYSDGPIEDELLEIAKNVKSSNIKSVIDEKKSWPVLYHFSDQRENIVNWLPITKSDKLLEVGSGCGAITGAFCRMAGSVTSVDLSKKRSSVNAYRHEEADNLTIHVGNFLDIEPDLDTDYDYVCLIGVFEYGQSYMGGDKPFHTFLNILKKHVKKGGRIVIAIENKLGLKYFAGCREDHLGSYFSGIESYPEGGYVRTFSRPGLEKIFKECACDEYHFYYPYPDYKFPTTIFSDKRLPLKGELTNNIRNFDRERLLLFDEKNAFDGIIEDGLFPTFSNSYMVVIGPDTDTDFIRYSNERRPDYAISTVMKKDMAGNTVVRKYPENIQAIKHIKDMELTYRKLSEKYADSSLKVCPVRISEDNQIPYAEFDFIKGITLSERFDSLIASGDMPGFINLLKEFVERIAYNQDYPFNDLDLVFSNVITDGDDWTIIDYEWTEEVATNPKVQAYRALYCYTQENEFRQKLDLSECFKLLEADSAFVEEYTKTEFDFHKKVQDEHFSLAQLREEIGCSVIHPEKYFGANSVSERVERVQIYTDRGAGYSEADSYFIKKAKFDGGKLTFDITFSGDVKNLRIDPMMGAGVVYIDKLTINDIALPDSSKKYLECNGRKLRGDREGYIFDMEDPNMNLHLSGIKLNQENSLHAEMSYVYMDNEAAHGILTAVKKLI